ncbi:MAG TPA: hypothetical protein VE978_16960 [Chitinophagales bacterium]|nr:hypothetical protein [Chitinophagales bacterium]
MKTLKIALASALIVLSLNSFAGTCNPCVTSGNLIEDSTMTIVSDMPHDAQVNDLLQKMTVAVHQQIINTTAGDSKKHKHGKRKARS